MLDLYKDCRLCPRNCGVNRLAGEVGFCGETAELRIGFAGIHKGEEPPLVGTGGSGTIFVCGCNLKCAFCQNWQISQGSNRQSVSHSARGVPDTVSDTLPEGCKSQCQRSASHRVTPAEFVQICAALQKKGAENINIVTGSHAVPALIEGFTAAKKAGVDLPVVWNSSAYENVEVLELLKNHVDIWLPDLKTLDSGISAKYFNTPDYPQTAAAAILKMIELASCKPKSKVIIRHLILPDHLDSTRNFLKWYSENAKDKAQLSIMTQYTPIPNRDREMPNRFVTEEEYETVLQWLEEYKIEDGFCQELVTGSEWLPDFKRPNPFSSELSVPVLIKEWSAGSAE